VLTNFQGVCPSCDVLMVIGLIVLVVEAGMRKITWRLHVETVALRIFISRIPEGAGKFSLHHRVSDRFWGPPSLLSNGYQGLFPGGKAAGA
jgi:hypothetical protein